MGASIINKANKIQEANAINSANINTNQFNLSDKYIRLYENKDDSFTSKIFNLVKIQSTSYTIHGGKSYGDNKGIDLATQDLAFFKALQKLTNKYKIELENANNVIRVEVGYGKSEIDLRGQTTPNGGKVEWISQFDNKVKKKYGKSGCNAVSRLILRKSGLGENSGVNSNTYILAQEKGRELKTEIDGTNLRHNKFIKTADGQIDTTQQQSYLKISSSNTLKEAISYLDSELEKGYPIMIGVDHTYDKRLNETKDDIDGKRYNEYTTDHFVVIVGRKYDNKGDLYYLFYEVGTSDENKGKNDNNKLYIKNGMLQGITQSTFKNYVVTQVRRNQHK